MKFLLTSILLFFTALVYGQEMSYKPVKTFIIDLNHDNIPDTITLSSSLKDKLLFNKISISITRYKKTSFIASEYWTDVDSSFLINNKNAINTHLFFLTKRPKQSVILLFGNLDGAGYREEFSIINITNDKPKMVFNHSNTDIDVEIPVNLINLNKGGKLDFIFTAYHELYQPVDSLNADIGTYVPYWVYTIDDSCYLNKPLTKEYNEEHYVFAGFDYSEKIKVLYPRNGGKPRIIK